MVNGGRISTEEIPPPTIKASLVNGAKRVLLSGGSTPTSTASVPPGRFGGRNESEFQCKTRNNWVPTTAKWGHRRRRRKRKECQCRLQKVRERKAPLSTGTLKIGSTGVVIPTKSLWLRNLHTIGSKLRNNEGNYVILPEFIGHGHHQFPQALFRGTSGGESGRGDCQPIKW